MKISESSLNSKQWQALIGRVRWAIARELLDLSKPRSMQWIVEQLVCLPKQCRLDVREGGQTALIEALRVCGVKRQRGDAFVLAQTESQMSGATSGGEVAA